MGINIELWKKDGTTYWHHFAQANEAVCTEAWQVKEGVPCPFTQDSTIGDIGNQEPAVTDKQSDEPYKGSPTAANGGRGKRNARSKR